MASPFRTEIVPQAPPDPVFGLTAAFEADDNDQKVDLIIGAYRDDKGKPWILPVVEKADKIVRSDPNFNHEYSPIAGSVAFTSASQKVVFRSNSAAIKEKRVASVQTISGTGACHLGGLFLAKFYTKVYTHPKIYLSNPTWANHKQIFENVGLVVANYQYWHAASRALDIDGMLEALNAAPEHSIILLHACAHNPTGVDPTQKQWIQIADVMKKRNLFPFFDTAYQGFASGDLDNDGWAVRHFVEQNFELIVAQSYAKNFGLYGERIGCFHYVAAPGPEAQDQTERVASQLSVLQRSEISNPPVHGSKIVATALNDKVLFAEWERNLFIMSSRIKDMRKALQYKLEDLETPGTWDHITDQIGMFSFTGLTEAQVAKLQKDDHIYMTKNGRISMAGLNFKNVERVAERIDNAVRNA